MQRSQAASSVTIRYNRLMDWINAPQTHEAIPVAHADRPLPATLTVLYAPDGDRAGQSVVLGSKFELGRLVTDFGGQPFADGEMSRLHATVRHIGDQITVEDGGSTNGTIVNGAKVRRQQLEPGDILQVGGTFFCFDRIDTKNLVGLAESELVGVSAGFSELAQALQSVAPRLTPVLISGEPGVGKRAVAREITRVSRRETPPLVIHCSAGPTDKVEESLFGRALSAAMNPHELGGALKATIDGTLVLVDVERLSVHAQARLAWTMEELSRSGDGLPPRMIATTALSVASIEERVRSGVLRADLFGMLRAWTVEIPALRHRRQDVPVLVKRFVHDFALSAGRQPSSMPVEPELMWALIDYPWPRNVDELRSVVEAACVEASAKERALALSRRLQKLIGRHTLAREQRPGHVAAPRSRSELLATLQEHDYVISRVAAHFGKHRQQIYRWMDRFGIDRGVSETSLKTEEKA